MPNLFCIRADYGTYSPHFIKGGYAGIGFIHTTDLSNINSREELYPLFKMEHPEVTSNIVIGQQIGQIARFLLEMKAGDFVITPAADTDLLYYGQVASEPSYYYSGTEDGCRYNHRRLVNWAKEPLKRGSFSVPFQNTIRSLLTVYAIEQRDEFFKVIGRRDLISRAPSPYDAQRVVLEQILQLDDKEFEILITHLITALGFEGSEATGKVGDGGVDAVGELNVANLAKVKVYIQAKRYKLGTKISANTVRQLRQAIPFGGQGAFITTADFRKDAADIALEPGFPRIGLINGNQLVDLLVEHWPDIPEEFRERLGLKPGLVRI